MQKSKEDIKEGRKKLFGTDGIRAEFGQFPFLPSLITELGHAIAIWLQATKIQNTVAIGEDTRFSSATIKDFLSRGLLEEGISIINLGIVSTPCLAYLVRNLKLGLGIMISASHNPYYDNGIKIFLPNGTKLAAIDEAKIEEIFYHLIAGKDYQNYSLNSAWENGDRDYDANSYWVNIYLNFLQSLYRTKNGKRFKIVIDCANGAVTEIAPRLFRNLNMEVKVINASPDGYNINHNAGAVYPHALSFALKEMNADIGFAYDGDGDRLILSDENGVIHDGDTILALCGIAMAKKGILNKRTVIATEISNLGLKETLNAEGINLIQTAVGDKNVLNKMLEGNYNLGGESSGHIIFLDEGPWGDGLITSLKVLEILSERNISLSELTNSVIKYPQVKINIPVKQKIPLDKIAGLKEFLLNEQNKLQDKGRIHIRYSGTQPLLRILIEAKHGIDVDNIASQFVTLLKKYIQ